ncbi:hypothetical protein ACWEJ6_12730 [Nonomuraea sp. NPDC004702]
MLGREHQAMVFPSISRPLPLGILHHGMCLELGEEFERARA